MAVPMALEAERGIASVALNNPTTFLNRLDEKRFNTSDIFDPMSRAVVEVILDLTSRSVSTDVRVVFESLRERIPTAQFSELTTLYTLMPIEGALPNLLDVVKATAKRRALMMVMQEGLAKIDALDVKTPDLVNQVQMQVDAIQNELNPPAIMDTKSMLMDAIQRYEKGDDESQRIKTGFDKLDNLTPIRLGDFVVIGGETKSGKTMLALNIIANLLK
jgi:replicative DNA helicase